MKGILAILASLALCCVTTTPVLATSGFSCTIDDKNLSFTTDGALGSGMGSPIVTLKAQSDLKLKGTPADLVKLDLSKSLVHSWVESPDFRLNFYSEPEGDKPHGYFEIVITAKYVGDEGEARGNYRLTVFYTEPSADQTDGTYLKAKGKVSCFVE
jgi:hypothetical protein